MKPTIESADWGFGGDHTPWILLLVITVVLCVYGVIVQTYLSQGATKRQHNHAKTLNECLAGHHLGYASFYFAILTARFHEFGESRIMAMVLAMISSLFFYIIGTKYVVDQDRNIAPHECDATPCQKPLPKNVRWQVLGVNAVTSALAFLAALTFAISPIVVHRDTAPVTTETQGKQSTASTTSAVPR
jgi:hypothetical protein